MRLRMTQTEARRVDFGGGEGRGGGCAAEPCAHVKRKVEVHADTHSWKASFPAMHCMNSGANLLTTTRYCTVNASVL